MTAAIHPSAAASGEGANPLKLQLPGGILINGRFDVAYERNQYTTDPTEGADAIRNFHHFVFLSRRAKADPFFFNAEVIDQSFFEFGAAFKGDIWKFKAKAGKLLVPFGADPLFHHAYGGLIGFDQEILPAVWAAYGLSTSMSIKIDPVNLMFDLYGIAGYGLDKPDDVLSLKSDFAALDDHPRPAFGMRAGISYGPAKLQYSLIVNPLGLDRMLLMSAVDLTIWRIPDIPFVEDLALTIGFMRADVTGGSAKDYYHFGDYLELRYYPVDWLYFQYRGGFQSNDNRASLYFDDRRIDPDDGSAHTLAVTGRWFGFSLTLQHTWRLEEGTEVANDFLRLTLAYDF